MVWYGKQVVARLIYLPAIVAAQVTSQAQSPIQIVQLQSQTVHFLLITCGPFPHGFQHRAGVGPRTIVRNFAGPSDLP